jgi:hypothetical protein
VEEERLGEVVSGLLEVDAVRHIDPIGQIAARWRGGDGLGPHGPTGRDEEQQTKECGEETPRGREWGETAQRTTG